MLLARLRVLLRRGARERPTVLETGDLRLDPAAKQAWRGPVEVELAAGELALLEFLLRHRGEAVSKREILQHVWDDEFEGRPQHRRGLRPPPPQQARPPVRAGRHPDRPRHGYRLGADGG